MSNKPVKSPHTFDFEEDTTLDHPVEKKEVSGNPKQNPYTMDFGDEFSESGDSLIVSKIPSQAPPSLRTEGEILNDILPSRQSNPATTPPAPPNTVNRGIPTGRIAAGGFDETGAFDSKQFENFVAEHGGLPSAESLDAIPSASPNFYAPKSGRDHSMDSFAETGVHRSGENAVPGMEEPEVRDGDERNAHLSEKLDRMQAEKGDADPLLNQVIGGRYHLQSLLGRGGMGAVYKAVQLDLNRTLAIKVLRQSLAFDSDQTERFRREAWAMTRFTHPNSVTVFDFGEWNGHLYLVLEWLDGVSLRELIDEEGVVGNERICSILAGVCSALSEAHRLNIIHRDLKPENIMILKDRDGNDFPKVLDFGLATVTEEAPGGSSEKLTKEGMVIGTPSYMAPEQIQAQPLETSTDVYAMGVILFEMLCGHTPYEGTNWTIMMQHMFADPTPPSEAHPELNIHRGLEQLALWAMSKSPEARPRSIDEFRQELLMALDDSRDASVEEEEKFRLPTSRAERADAIGLPGRKKADLSEAALREVVLIVMEEQANFSDTITAKLCANGFVVRPVGDVDEILVETRNFQRSIVVIDIRNGPMEQLNKISSFVKSHQLEEVPIVVLGPEDSIDPMRVALESGFADYIPESKLLKKLPKSVKKIKRKKRWNK